MSDAKNVTGNAISLNRDNHSEAPMLDLSQQDIRQRNGVVKVLFALFMLVIVVACVLMAITGHWFFAGLCFLLGMWLLFHLDRTFGPYIRFTCPHCDRENDLVLSSVNLISGHVGHTACTRCKKEIRYRLVD